MSRIGGMEIVLSADAAALLTALDRVERRLGQAEASATRHAATMASSFQRIGRAVQAAGVLFAGWVAAVGTSRLIGWFRGAAEEVDKLGKAANRLGVSTEFLSGLKFAAGEAGIEFNTLSTMVSRAARSVSQMVDRGQTIVQLGRINVQLTDARGQVRNLAELLPELARGIESVGSEAAQLNLAQKLFGQQGGDQFVTLLKDGGSFMANLATQMERAKRLGIVFDRETVDRLTAMNDAIGRVGHALFGLRVNLLTRIAPTIEDVANRAAGAIAAVPELVERVVRVIRAAFDENGGDLADRLASVMQRLGDVAKRGVEFGIRVAFGVAEDMLKLAFPALQDIFERGFADSILRPAVATMEAFVTMVRFAFPKAFPATMTGINAVLEMVQMNLNPALSETRDIFESLESGRSPAWQRQWLLGSAKLLDALRDLGLEADELLQVSELLAKHAMTGFERVSGGAAKALAPITDLQERLAEFAAESTRLISGFAGGAADVLAELAIDGEQRFEDLSRSWAKALLSMAAQTLVLKPIFEAFGGSFGGLFSQSVSLTPTQEASIAHAAVGFAHGGVVEQRGGWVAKAARGMVFTQRTFIPSLNAEVGEGGRKEVAFAPLRTIGGDLGVKSVPAQVSVQIIDQRGAGARPEVSSHTGPDGVQMIRVLIRDEVNRGISDGTFDRAMSNAFGARRRGVGR